MKLPFKLRLFLHRNSKYVYYTIFTSLILFTITLMYTLYIDFKGKTLSTYCYAFFAGNAIAANCLFSLGRSNVFIDRFPEKSNQKKIYISGLLFLIAAIFGLGMSGFTYFEFANSLLKENELLIKCVHFITAIFLTLGAILSCVAVINFFAWLKIESDIFLQEEDQPKIN